eukprot:48264-Alexandrium_andersonii.AAC.1
MPQPSHAAKRDKRKGRGGQGADAAPQSTAPSQASPLGNNHPTGASEHAHLKLVKRTCRHKCSSTSRA